MEANIIKWFSWLGATKSRQVGAIVALFLVMSLLFYVRHGRYDSLDSHIPASILAKQYGYDLSGFGLSFVSAKGVNDSYGPGAARILQEGIVPQGFSHYTSTIGIQGFIYVWLYEVLHLQSLKLLYVINALLNALGVLLLCFSIKRVFGSGFSVVFLLSLLLTPMFVKVAGSLYFSLLFWILPAIISFTIYSKVGLYMQKINQKIVLALLCLLYMLFIAVRCAMSYEFITSIILFSLTPFILVVLNFILKSCGIARNESVGNDIRSRVDSKVAECGGFCKIDVRSAFIWACGLFALSVLAFAIVFAYHAFVRGGGDLIAGLRDIYEHDFLRRMVWGNTKDFDPVYADSLNASVINVVLIYLSRGICLLLGMCIMACIIEQDSKMRCFYIALLLAFALPALSWFVFGKSHSYIHTHFCPALWNLGFWVALFYVPLHCFCRKAGFITLSK